MAMSLPQASGLPSLALSGREQPSTGSDVPFDRGHYRVTVTVQVWPPEVAVKNSGPEVLDT